jgi:hypothetical protein
VTLVRRLLELRQDGARDAAVDAVLAGDMDRVRAVGAPLTIAGETSRAIICAAPGHVPIGADFSAIESRVLAWRAGEKQNGIID